MEGRAVPDWLVRAWGEFRSNLADPEYPCFFGGQALRANAIHHSYVEAEGSDHLPHILRHFLHTRRDHPLANLAIFFEPLPEEGHSATFARFWSTLTMLQEADADATWEEREADPDEPLWEFTFSGVQMFVVGISPSYRNRRSRNLGDCMIMLFQPRDVFDVSDSGPDAGSRARALIRKRLRLWDGIGHHVALGVYGDADNREWAQYFLPDDNHSPVGVCPMRRLARAQDPEKA